ncbi:hypothetical protein TMEN_6614 [Trichophyton mentagrophytes]|nr:hypothetical protein TMEN_6614 [Trichophyton mentagrophytes]
MAHNITSEERKEAMAVVSLDALRAIIINESTATNRARELERLLHQAGQANQQERVAHNYSRAQNTQLQGRIGELTAINNRLKGELQELQEERALGHGHHPVSLLRGDQHPRCLKPEGDNSNSPYE